MMEVGKRIGERKYLNEYVYALLKCKPLDRAFSSFISAYGYPKTSVVDTSELSDYLKHEVPIIIESSTFIHHYHNFLMRVRIMRTL